MIVNDDSESRHLSDGEPATPLDQVERAETLEGARESRAARRDKDVDPTKGKVLHRLTALEFEAEHGRPPKLVELNRLFPASAAGAQRSGVWNEIAKGAHLPRTVAAPQGLLMRKLTEVYPKAAASFTWPIWSLSSWKPLSLPEIHALMLRLPEGIRQMLIGSYSNGRYLRYPTDPRHEVGFMVQERSLGGITALIALMREAELRQDAPTHGEAYYSMLQHLPVLDESFGSADLGQAFSGFLKDRFSSMDFIVPGAYETQPGGSGVIAPVRFRLSNRLDQEEGLRQHAQWLGLPAQTFEAVLHARRQAQEEHERAMWCENGQSGEKAARSSDPTSAPPSENS